MEKGRLEAFSDGVIAIIITIMVLELKVPHGSEPSALEPLLPLAMTYLLSFVFVGIYWNNHHHMLHATPKINGWIMWANLHLLFWLSLVPVATGWLGENYLAVWPTAVYGTLLLIVACAYQLLTAAIVSLVGRTSLLATAVGSDLKGKASLLIYLVAVPLAFVRPWISDLMYVLVAVLWFAPDRRIEKAVTERAR
ncbi:MAG: TMEM175 family protein [Polyangiaceae bacterium]